MTTNNFKPILFSTEMVQAILAGRKTQTRRTLKQQQCISLWGEVQDVDRRIGWDLDRMVAFYSNKGSDKTNLYSYREPAKYKKGDILWVRESAMVYKIEGTTGFHLSGEKPVGFKSIQKIGIEYCDGERVVLDYPERLSLNTKCGKKLPYGVFKEAARIFLKVTNVRVERLQDINAADSVAEGISDVKFNYHKSINPRVIEMTAQIMAFRDLWDSINAKKNPWDSNPWVWVYEFERIEKPENFLP